MNSSGCCNGCASGECGLQPALSVSAAGGGARSRRIDRGPALLISAAATFLPALLLRLIRHPAPLPFLVEALFLLAFALSGAGTIWKALRDLGRGLPLNEHFLMSLAAVGAIALGEYPEAAAIMILFNTGELLEAATLNRSRRSIAALLETKPDYANLLRSEDTAERVDPEDVSPGDLILVRPGEKIALDGIVASGDSSVSNAALTGEALPQSVYPGDAVLAGAVNGPGLLKVRVERPFSGSSLAQIYRLVQESAVRKAPPERFMTAFARRYTPVVVTGALLLGLLPPLLIPDASFRTWLYRALILLVISCPCALVISIPLGYLAGIAGAARQGILVKGGSYLEALRKVKTIAFDKTGTITEGVFQVKGVETAPGVSTRELLEWAAYAEAHSSHPIARSIREAYPGELHPGEIGLYEEIRGLGVKAKVRGRIVLAGSLQLLLQEKVENIPPVPVERAVHVAVGGSYAGSLVVGDRVRQGAARAVRQLKELGVQRTVLLTGDQGAAAQEAVSRSGIDLAYASLMPEKKVAHLETLLRETASAGGRLAYVGDGVNDAPALSRADIGIAMGGAGSDAAIEAADVVIMDDRLTKIAAAMRISAFTHRVVLQNIVLALGMKVLFLAAGALGAVTIWGALFADVGVSLLAIANAARILGAASRKEHLYRE